MIRKLVLENFRSFVDRTELEIRPLTLIFGLNNSGKSTLLRAIPLVAASLEGKPGMPLALDHPAARGASFPELTSQASFQTRAGLHIGIELENGKERIKASWDLLDLPELRRQVIERCTFSTYVTDTASWIPAVGEDSRVSDVYEIHRKWADGSSSSKSEVRFNGLLPRHFAGMEDAAVGLWEVGNDIRDFHSSVEWLTSVREAPSRSSLFLAASNQPLTATGKNAGDILAADWRGSQFESIGLRVSSWYERHTNHRIAVQWEGDRYRLMTEMALGKLPTRSPARVNIVDAGEGLIQVLPILVSLAKAERGEELDPRVVTIEEPESHLHPRLHAALAEEFCRVVAAPSPPTIVVETHSENILLRLQIAIATGLSPEKVIVHWVRQLEDGRSQVDPVIFDDTGHPNGNWPRMVFAEDSRQAQILLEAQLKRSQVSQTHAD